MLGPLSFPQDSNGGDGAVVAGKNATSSLALIGSIDEHAAAIAVVRPPETIPQALQILKSTVAIRFAAFKL